MTTFGVEWFSEDTLIIQRDGGDVLNVTEAAMGPGVTLPKEDRLAIFRAISVAVVNLNKS